MNRYWVFFYTFVTLEGAKGTGFTHLTTTGSKHISISKVKQSTAKLLMEEYKTESVTVGITSFNELNEKDYQNSL